MINFGAQNGRWNEEVILVSYKMRWTVQYFLHRAEQWDRLGVGNESSSLAPGPTAYAAHKAAMWRWVASPVQVGEGESSCRSQRATKKCKAAVESIPNQLSNGELAQMFTEYSARELSWVQQAPETKWTWGTNLTEANLCGIVRVADNDFQIPHSDYDISLPMGRIGGVASMGQDLD